MSKIIKHWFKHDFYTCNDNKLQKLFIKRNGFIVSLTDSNPMRYDQIKGRDLVGYFKNGKMDLYLTGGLMDYTLSNLLIEINNQVHLEATGIKTIYDNHQNTSSNLKRLSYRGRVSLDKVIGNNLLQVNDV